MSNNQITLTQEQLEKLTYLAETGITGEPRKDGKLTIQQITYQAIERGISSIEQTRKQYMRSKQDRQLFREWKESNK